MLQEFGLIAAIFNFFSMLGNLWWSVKLNSVRTNHELISYWKEQYEVMKDELEKQVALNKQLEKKQEAYHEFHGHEPLALMDEKA